jgi:hypothetical protein
MKSSQNPEKAVQRCEYLAISSQHELTCSRRLIGAVGNYHAHGSHGVASFLEQHRHGHNGNLPYSVIPRFMKSQWKCTSVGLSRHCIMRKATFLSKPDCYHVDIPSYMLDVLDKPEDLELGCSTSCT